MSVQIQRLYGSGNGSGRRDRGNRGGSTTSTSIPISLNSVELGGVDGGGRVNGGGVGGGGHDQGWAEAPASFL